MYVVTPDWIIDSIHACSRQLESNYHPNLLAPPPAPVPPPTATPTAASLGYCISTAEILGFSDSNGNSNNTLTPTSGAGLSQNSNENNLGKLFILITSLYIIQECRLYRGMISASRSLSE